MQTINPATEEPLKTYHYLSEGEVKKAIEISFHSFTEWKKTDFNERCNNFKVLANLLLENKNELARIISLEMGKPIKASVAEIEKCSRLCGHYAEHGKDYLASRSIDIEHQKSLVVHQPIGLVLAVMPWNFPFWQVFRCAVPAIMAGNGVILKHAPITTECGVKIEELFEKAHFPVGLFKQLIIDNEGVSQVIANKNIAAISFTGSERTGRILASQAGQYLKKSVLELGGSDPYIVLHDADLELAARCIVESRLSNSGQVCIAAKRIIVMKTVAEALLANIMKLVQNYIIGDPFDPLTNMGPLAREDLRTQLHLQVQKTIKSGAKLLCGGIIPEGKGYYYPPTVLRGVKPGMPAFDEELFGPVIAVVTANSEQEAIDLANDSSFGLGAAVFTKDIPRGENIAVHLIEAGTCYVNSIVVSDPALPFGGTKGSGYGRELSKEGILEFVNTKTVVVKY